MKKVKKAKKQGTIYILFADGGWIEFDPWKRELVATGDDWSQTLQASRIAPTSIYRAVPVCTLMELMVG